MLSGPGGAHPPEGLFLSDGHCRDRRCPAAWWMAFVLGVVDIPGGSNRLLGPVTTFKHFILTLFNTRVSHGQGVLPDPVWMEHRFELFGRFCYPSVRGQRGAEFLWMVFFDAETPPEFRRRIDAFARWDRFIPVFVRGEMSARSFAGMKDRVIGERAGNPEMLVTTLLDNDDALHRDYLARVQAEVRGQKAEVLNVTNGYVLDLGAHRLYSKKDYSNPFLSVIEPFDGFQTAWRGPHHLMGSFGPVRQLITEPLWLQVVHGRNISNRVGVHLRRPLTELGGGFTLGYPSRAVREPRVPLLLENVVNGARLLWGRLRGEDEDGGRAPDDPGSVDGPASRPGNR